MAAPRRSAPVRSKRRLGLSFAVTAPLLAATLGAYAEDAPDLNTIQQQIQAGQEQQAQLKAKADALDKEIADLQASAVKAAGQVQDTESQVTQLEDTLAALADEEKEK